MIAAAQPVQRHMDARLLVIERDGNIRHAARTSFVEHLHEGDLVIANDAATLPASLSGIHQPTGCGIEVRLGGRESLSPDSIRAFSAIVFGAGDFHTRTEDRPLPPPLEIGDRLRLGPLNATVRKILGHPRLISLGFEGSTDDVWAGISRHGRPIQYAHIQSPLALWDVWTPIAGPPVAFEPPSAGFVIDWRLLQAMRRRRIGFAAITHAAGISSTGDDKLDSLLPFDEPYRIPGETARAIIRAKLNGGRIVAIGTTVVRALEHAASVDGIVPAGESIATQRIGAGTRLKVVDAIISGTHEPGTSHYELLRAFTDDSTLERASRILNETGYLTHEFGDSVLVEKSDRL